jgi:hypothetical protein
MNIRDADHTKYLSLESGGYSDDVDQVFRRHGDQDSEVMPITYSELMAIRSERSDAGLLHRALR